jgi:hypothetical protein
MDDERFLELRALIREQRAFEAKQTGSMNDQAFVARVIRAALAMANQQPRKGHGVVTPVA